MKIKTSSKSFTDGSVELDYNFKRLLLFAGNYYELVHAILEDKWKIRKKSYNWFLSHETMNANLNSSRINLENQSLQAAAQAAAQINAQLAAEGKLLQQQNQHANNQLVIGILTAPKKDKKVKTGRKDLFSAEVEINDLPPRVRNLLTKGYIQEQIQWKSKAALCTKGRYIVPRDKSTTTDERPLYICIQAVEKQAVDEAVLQIQQFILEHTNGCNPAPAVTPQSIVPNHPPPQVPMIQDKVYINLDHAPPSFKMLERVLGSDGDNVNYIQTETSVNVSLRGKGLTMDCDDPLHLLLQHADPKAVENARSLALSLVGTLQQDFVQWQQQQVQLQQQQQQQQQQHHHHHHQQQQQQQQQSQQQQSQQQVVYTFTQPYYGGTTSQNSNYHCPTLAMIYGTCMPNGVRQTSSTSEQRNVAMKRPSRFDYQQHSGHLQEDPSSKRAKAANQAYPSI